MKRNILRLLSVLLLAAAAAFCLAVSASAAERSLSLPKTEYGQNENILVTAYGEGKDWVGIYARGETPGNPASIYWYYVAEDAEPGEAVDIRETRSNNRAEYDMLPPGEYTVWLLLDDGYEPYDSIDITIKATLELDKYSYKEGDDILVTANGEGKDWVGLYLKDEVPGGGPVSIYWYYVAEGHTPMEPVNIKTGTMNDSRSDLADIPAGEYTIVLCANDGYDIIDSVDFKVSAVKKEEPKAEAEPEPEAPAAEPSLDDPSKDEPAEDTPEPAADATTTGATDTAAAEKKGGCGSFIGGSAVVLFAVLGSAWMAKRKD